MFVGQVKMYTDARSFVLLDVVFLEFARWRYIFMYAAAGS